MRINCETTYTPPRTHGGSVAAHTNAVQKLRRSVMSCLLWEKEFYESGESISERIANLVPQVPVKIVSEIAIEAREKMHLRHVPLLIVREMARHETHRGLVSHTLRKVIQRPDELSEFLAIYWKDGRQPLSAQVKKGLASAFQKFDEYSLAKYNQNRSIKLRDVLFLCHAKPNDQKQEVLWKRLVSNQLTTPDTWEVALSSTKDKTAEWTRLVKEEKLGGLAFLRNLRNMSEAGVPTDAIAEGLQKANFDKVLPFRFLAAAKHAPQHEEAIEKAMFNSLSKKPKLYGKTIFVVDVSGSMNSPLSAKSNMDRLDTACSLAVLIREICESVQIYATGGNDHERKHSTKLVPSRRGFALRDAIIQDRLGGGGIFLAQCTEYIQQIEKEADRLIVLTDEQDCDDKLNPSNAKLFGKKNYIINIASNNNGIGYDKWIHIDGWSESILDYIANNEAFPQQIQ